MQPCNLYCSMSGKLIQSLFIMIMMMIVIMMRTLKSLIRVITVMVISKAFFKLEGQAADPYMPRVVLTVFYCAKV